ncbi:DUF5685 family protein [Planotetraspora sp. GP83]|uniref:DUF5685 family protein n=1 Tax=Planotetraspora sp. GP83 TaxID=3156264 RepID=UPI0035193F38
MFGILRPCAHSCPAVHEAWRAHLCGLCLTLRDRHGQLARTATNYDGLVLSVLAEAQSPRRSERRKAGPCPLRGFKTAEVVSSEGAQLAAVVSLALAAGKISDHAADGDGLAGRRVSGAPLRRVAASWTSAAERGARSIGFDAAVLTAAAGRQAVLEATPGLSLLELTEPTEAAAAAAFAHTATLAGVPRNNENLREAGRYFGRIAHLLDAVEDLEDDRARGAYNPLVATGTSPEEARRLCDEALHGLELAVRDLELAERHLVEALLRDEARRAVRRAFAEHAAPPGAAEKVLAGVATFFTCGVYRPPWSRHRDQPWGERCYLDGCDCPDCGCDAGCCDCCSGDCCSGDCCSCDGCSCDCDCGCCDCGS